MKLMIEHIRIY